MYICVSANVILLMHNKLEKAIVIIKEFLFLSHRYVHIYVLLMCFLISIVVEENFAHVCILS